MLKRKALSYVALAQLDRASGYGPEGQGFESLMLRQQNPTRLSWAFVFYAKGIQTCAIAHRNYVAPRPAVRLHAIDLR